MAQFVTPEHQKKKKEKPKKEVGAWMDIVQAVAPMAASIVGTPLAGAAVSALLEGTEAKLEGGSFKEALMKGLISGGIGAATGGIASGLGGAATEGAKQVGKGVVEKAGQEVLDQTIKGGLREGGKFSLGLAAKQGGDLVGKEAVGQAVETVGKNAVDSSMKEILKATGGEVAGEVAGDVAGAAGESAAKTQFLEHVTDLGEMGLGMHQEMQAERESKKRYNEAMNQQMMKGLQEVQTGKYTPPSPRFYRSYGG